ncbi:MAG TPA: MFS transporter [Caulobacteraceae bacterium]|nr:MFS transporter [Caulobacteraceae bacterium]
MAATEFAAIDEQRFRAFHWRATLTTGLGVFCDGYDLSSIGLVLTLVLASFGHTAVISAASGALTAAALVGSAVGALLFGVLGQKGRKRFYGYDVLILGVAAIAQAFAPNLPWLIGIRFALGIGVGADYVLSPTIMAEHANRADRGRALGLGFGTMWPIGAVTAALVLLVLKALGVSPDLQWRIVLAGGAIPAFSVLYFRRRMPETARYLAKLAGDAVEAGAVMTQIAGRQTAAPARDDRSFWTVFAAHARPILSAALLWMIYDLVVYFSVLFGPSVIAKSVGLSPAGFTLLLELVFLIPTSVLFSVFLIDRIGRKALQGWGFFVGAIMVTVFAAMQHQIATAPVLGFAVFGLFNLASTGPGIVSGAGILGVELAPTRIRSVAQSITVAAGRIGAATSGYGFPWLISHIGQAGAYYVIGLLGLLGALCTWLLVPETGRISLEAINREESPAPA